MKYGEKSVITLLSDMLSEICAADDVMQKRNSAFMLYVYIGR